MRARSAGSVARAALPVAVLPALLVATTIAMACSAPRPPDSQRPPVAAGSLPPGPSPSAPAPRLTYNPAQWPDPLDAEWLGGEWLLVAAVPGPQIEPLRYYLDFGRRVLVTDEDGKPLEWAGRLESVEWSDPRGTWTIRLDAEAPCGDATYSVTIKGGLLFIPVEESCRERFQILVNDAWMRSGPVPSEPT